MDAEEYLPRLSELTYWEITVGRATAQNRVARGNVSRVTGIPVQHLEAAGPLTALISAAVPWTGYEGALAVYNLILHADNPEPWSGAELQAFVRFWRSIGYWPGVILSTEDRIQYGTTVRDDGQAAADYRAAHSLSRTGTSDRLLFTALRNPGMLASHHAVLHGLAEEYAAEALGLDL